MSERERYEKFATSQGWLLGRYESGEYCAHGTQNGWQTWQTALADHATAKNLPKEWLEYGLWRWKMPPYVSNWPFTNERKNEPACDLRIASSGSLFIDYGRTVPAPSLL